MKSEYAFALSAAAVAVIAAAIGMIFGSETAFPWLVAAAGAGPVAVLAAISGRLEERVTPPAIIGGGTVGPLVAVASHAAVGLFVYAFVIGFADTFTGLLDRFRADPELVDVLSSPWLLVSLISLAAVAPLTEESRQGSRSRLRTAHHPGASLPGRCRRRSRLCHR